MNWLLDTFRTYPSIPILLTVGLGFWIGQFKYKSFSLGTVTSVLLTGVIIGQMQIPISPPIKSLFFLIFLFAIGYQCGPQFASALKGQGIKQVLYAVMVCFLCLVVTLICAKIMNYNAAISTGLFSGAQTISAVIGVGADTINTLHMSPEKKKEWIDLLPVCYAVTYVFGTIGSAWILGNIGPKLLGGLEKVKKATKELEEKLNHSAIGNDPAYVDGNQPIIFRAYKVTAEHFRTSRTVGEIENHFMASHKRLFVERVRNEDGIITQPSPKLAIRLGNEIVLSGRHEFLVGDESWIGPEINDTKLLTFAVERTRVMVSKKTAGLTIDQLRVKPFMYGVMIESLTRQGIDIPVLAQTQLAEGDMLTIMGLPQEVDTAAPAIGFEERPTTHTDMVFFGFALAIGAIVGAIKINFGAVPVSLSTSGGALIGGLFFGWLRTKRPSIGYIPSSSLWLMNNLGLNIFIAVIGIESGPTFVSGIQDVGFMLFIMGIVSTSLPLIIAVYLGEKLFKFHPAINLGCCAGSRTTTASLGAITTALGSSVPALGYTVTYAVGNTVLILMGVAMVLLSI